MSRPGQSLPSRESIGPDTPLRLDVAAALAYPDGSMTASGLRREAAQGRLAIERVAGKDYTTLAAIEQMRSLCRVPPREPASGSALKNETPTARSASARCGPSETDRARSARAALQRIAQGAERALGEHLSTNTSPTEGAAVIPLEILIADVLAIYLVDVAPARTRGRNQAARAHARRLVGG